MITGRHQITVKSRRIFFAENFGLLNSMEVSAIRYMPGTCVRTVHSFRQVPRAVSSYLCFMTNTTKVKSPSSDSANVTTTSSTSRHSENDSAQNSATTVTVQPSTNGSVQNVSTSTPIESSKNFVIFVSDHEYPEVEVLY